MTEEKEPDWSQSENWNEFEWEKAFKFSEKMTHEYFRLLNRFGDLPDAERFIATQLSDSEYFSMDEDDAIFEEPNVLPDDSNGFLASSEFPEGDKKREEIGPGNPMYYEVCSEFLRARQLSLCWCNVLSNVLTPEDRFWGLRILFYMGRILSYLAMCIGDGNFERIEGSIAFAKRVIHQLNKVLGEIDEKQAQTPHYAGIFKVVRELLLENHDLVVTLLIELRNRRDKKPEGEEDAGV